LVVGTVVVVTVVGGLVGDDAVCGIFRGDVFCVAVAVGLVGGPVVVCAVLGGLVGGTVIVGLFGSAATWTASQWSAGWSVATCSSAQWSSGRLCLQSCRSRP